MRVNGGYDDGWIYRSEVIKIEINIDNHDDAYEIDKKWNLTMMINDQVCFSFAFQVLEYHPHPWNQWVHIGDLVQARSIHATLSIGPEQLPCFLSGEIFTIDTINDDLLPMSQ